MGDQIMTFRGMAVSQDVFRDFCDPTGFLPKDKVADAVRCLGENPLQSEIREITNKFKSQGLNFQQFEEVVKIYKNMNQSPNASCPRVWLCLMWMGKGWFQ